MIEIRLDGFTGRPTSMFCWEFTTTGVKITLSGALAEAINALADRQVSEPQEK